MAEDLLLRDPSWELAYVDRGERMVLRDRNHGLRPAIQAPYPIFNDRNHGTASTRRSSSRPRESPGTRLE